MSQWYLELAQAVALLAVSLLGLALAIQFVRSLRDNSVNDQESGQAMLSNFREMHSRGELTTDEFRKIKTDISTRIRDAAKQSDDADQTG
jgi:uncharacterized membrane protein